MRDDLRQAIRFLWRRRSVTAIAVFTLAAGIGASTLIFSAADAAFFKPLPYREPDRLVDFQHVARRGTVEQTFSIGMRPEEARAWRAQTGIFDGLEMFNGARDHLMAAGGEPEEVQVGRLSIDMLSFLGVPVIQGRGFAAGEDVPGRDRVILLSDGFWKRRFGADPLVVGRSVRLDGDAYTVIGVTPAAFRFRAGGGADAWIPLSAGTAENGFVGTIARIRHGVTFEQASRDARASATWIGAHLARPGNLDVDLFHIDELRPADQLRTVVATILGASVILLLIACANVGNLLLALSVSRQREVAVRRALGASRARIVRASLLEGLALAGAGVAGGFAMTAAGVRAAPALVPARLGLFQVHDLQIDSRVVLFAIAMGFMSALLATIVTVVRPVDGGAGALQGRLRMSAPRHSGTRSVLLGGQVALTLVLLVGAGLLAASLAGMMRLREGFDAEGLGYVDVTLPDQRYPAPAQRDAFFGELVARIGRLPGVRGAARGTPPPVGLSGNFVAEGTESQSGTRQAVQLHWIGRDYFSVTSIHLRDGRVPGPADSLNAPPVAVISESAARKHWPDGEAIGKRFRYSPYGPWITVIGVADEVKTQAAASPWGGSQAYLPLAQESSTAAPTILVRMDPASTRPLASVRAVVSAMDPQLAVRKAGLVTGLYDDLYESPRFFVSLMSLFAAVALTIAAIGLGASLMHNVSRRTQEIGVRMALGADRWNVRVLVLRDSLRAVVGGLAAGIVAALWLGQVMDSMLFRVSGRDPLMIAAAATFLLAVAGIASYLPVRRATRIDPMIALRAE